MTILSVVRLQSGYRDMSERLEIEKSAIRVVCMAMGYLRSFRLAPFRQHEFTDEQLLKLAATMFDQLERELRAETPLNLRRSVPNGGAGSDDCGAVRNSLSRNYRPSLAPGLE